jgi:oxaloacetate decarboxylase beta subunit
MRLIAHSDSIRFSKVARIESHLRGYDLVEQGRAIMVNSHSVLGARSEAQPNSTVSYGQGRKLFVEKLNEDSRYPEIWSLAKQDVHNASIFWWLFAGVGLAGFFPPLIFLGIGALTDFGPMLSNPRTLLLGAAAQFGIFGSLLGAMALGFTAQEAGAIGIIGGADGPTAIFTASQLAPDLLGPVALAAYSYMAMVPIIQPPIIHLLTTRKERLIRMAHNEPVSQRVKIMFPIFGFLLTAFLSPGGIPLLGMLFFGNLLRESLVTERLAKTAQSALIDIVTILLGVTVGAKTSAANFLTLDTIKIFILGILAFTVATATGVLFGKLMNWMSRQPINPMIGAAGVSAVPMSARVVHKLGLQEDPQNFLLMHAMGPNVAGVIGSAVAAGVLLSKLA